MRTDANSSEERNAHLRKLGDTALVTSGFFAGSFERSAVGIDYFISMGGGAYSSLAENNSRTFKEKGLGEVFSDLAGHFMSYVDVLTEVRESNELTDDRDVLCLYESWLKTGSEYARKRLQENGVLTFPAPVKINISLESRYFTKLSSAAAPNDLRDRYGTLCT